MSSRSVGSAMERMTMMLVRFIRAKKDKDRNSAKVAGRLSTVTEFWTLSHRTKFYRICVHKNTEHCRHRQCNHSAGNAIIHILDSGICSYRGRKKVRYLRFLEKNSTRLSQPVCAVRLFNAEFSSTAPYKNTVHPTSCDAGTWSDIAPTTRTCLHHRSGVCTR